MCSYLLKNPTKEETITLTNATPHPLQKLISWLGRSYSDKVYVAMSTSPRDGAIINLSLQVQTIYRIVVIMLFGCLSFFFVCLM